MRLFDNLFLNVKVIVIREESSKRISVVDQIDHSILLNDLLYLFIVIFQIEPFVNVDLWMIRQV